MRFMRAGMRAVCLGGCVTLAATALADVARDDTALAEAVTVQLTQRWLEDGGALMVRVDAGVVELFGVASSPEMLDEAAEIAAGVDGVERVVNRLEVADLTVRPPDEDQLQQERLQQDLLQQEQQRQEEFQQELLRQEELRRQMRRQDQQQDQLPQDQLQQDQLPQDQLPQDQLQQEQLQQEQLPQDQLPQDQLQQGQLQQGQLQQGQLQQGQLQQGQARYE
jgi:hypothetical protein